MAKWAPQIDDAGPHPRARRARVHGRDARGGPGPVVLALPEDMLADEVDVADARPHRPARRPGAGRGGAAAAAARARRAAVVLVGEGGWTARRGVDVAAFGEAQRPAGGRVVPPPGLRRQHVARLRRPRRPRHRPARSRSGSATPTCCSRSARGWARSTTAGYTLLDIAGARAAARPRAPGPRRARARLPARARRSCAACALRRRRARRSTPVDGSAWRGATRGRRARSTSTTSEHRRAAGRANGRGHGALRERLADGRDRHQRRRQLHGLGAPLLRVPALPDPARADAAARWATACPPRSRPSCVHPERPVVCFAGDGDFLMTGQELATAVQDEAADRRARGQQRHVRHDPHAPGAALSRPRHRDRPAQPGLRRLAGRSARHGASVERTEDFAGRLRARPGRAAARPCSSCASIREAITPRGTLDAIRDAAAR